MSFAFLLTTLSLAPWTSADPTVEIADVLATCRDEATIVGSRGQTRDWRLFDACMAARGAHRPDEAWMWLPVSPVGCVGAEPTMLSSAQDWQGCLEDARFEDASGWPRIHAGEVSACMSRAGWRTVGAVEWVAATTSCRAPTVAGR